MSCLHEQSQVRQKLGPRPLVGAQCLECGSLIGKWLPKSQRPPEPILPWDDALQAAYGESRRLASLEAHKQKQREWWQKYNEYLKSPKWASKRRVVLGRDLDCRSCLSRPATQVHHLTYDHVFDEPLFDLVGVCAPCHDLITNIDRARRAGER